LYAEATVHGLLATIVIVARAPVSFAGPMDGAHQREEVGDASTGQFLTPLLETRH
jgi:hypothetical protein